MKKLILTRIAVVLTVTLTFAATLAPNSIFATSKENLEAAGRLAVNKDFAGLEEMDREGKINVFKTPLKINVISWKFFMVSFTFPGKTNVLYTASEFVTD